MPHSSGNELNRIGRTRRIHCAASSCACSCAARCSLGRVGMSVRTLSSRLTTSASSRMNRSPRRRLIVRKCAWHIIRSAESDADVAGSSFEGAGTPDCLSIDTSAHGAGTDGKALLTHYGYRFRETQPVVVHPGNAAIRHNLSGARHSCGTDTPDHRHQLTLSGAALRSGASLTGAERQGGCA
jgi:hypothetical protein